MIFHEMARHVCVYGGQYGSEGKASAAEFWAKKMSGEGIYFTVIGENSPNSGHTCSKGSTRNIPAASFWADCVLLGPDSVIDTELLVQDWEKVGRKHIYIHENAALMHAMDKLSEDKFVQRISSTGSGTGIARQRKYIDRMAFGIIKGYDRFPPEIHVIDDLEYHHLVMRGWQNTMLFECSQGVLLDPNFGRFPFVTTRCTLPRVAVERNGVGAVPWAYCGVYRTYPIRTGGPSGPTGGEELSWNELGREPEIATVTGRVRRVFEFSQDDMFKSLTVSRPDILMITFLDYIGVTDLTDLTKFHKWAAEHGVTGLNTKIIYVSNKVGEFVRVSTP